MTQFATLKQGITAPFLRPAGRLKLHITFEMDDRRILMGLVYPVRFGGFCIVQHGDAAAITAVNRKETAIYESKETTFEHPAHPDTGAGLDAGDEFDGVCGGAKSDLHSWRNK